MCRTSKVDPAGIITTVAGTGEAGYTGDGDPAVEATISSITGLAVDSTGDLYIADSGNDVVGSGLWDMRALLDLVRLCGVAAWR